MMRGNVALTDGRFEDAFEIFEDAIDSAAARAAPRTST